MTGAAEGKAISKQLAGRLFPLALAVGFIITLVIPGVYCAFEYRSASDGAHAYAKNLANDVGYLASESPTLWKYQSTKYAQILSSFVIGKNILSIVVLDEKAEPIFSVLNP